MGFFSSCTNTIAVIDIGSSSIGGGYATIEKNGTPRLRYVARVPIELHDRELLTMDMLKALDVLGKKLIQEGAPALRKAVGSGTIDKVLVSIGSPWQDTTIRSAVIEKETPFTFTKSILHEAVEEGAEHTEGRVTTGEYVIATLLNGYETRHPFGKQATRAELVILSSTIESSMTETVLTSLRHIYHTRDIKLTAFAPVSYTVLRDLYPHEKDFMIVHVSGESTDLALVKRGVLVDVASVNGGFNALARAARKGRPLSMTADGKSLPVGEEEAPLPTAKGEWLSSLALALREFASRRALPRTLFLLADDEAREHVARMLNDEGLRSLWLSDEPLTIIPSLPQHLSSYLTCDQGCDSDLFLSMLALSLERTAGIATT